MKLSIATFKGEAPRISPRALPDGMSQAAVNSRLLSGDLEAWKNFLEIITLSKSPPINTIFLMANQFWLEWNDSDLAAGAVEVDVAKSAVAGDTTNRIYLTGLDAPRYTNVALATTGSPPFPVETRLLGVGAPTDTPTLQTSVDTTSAATISLTNDFNTLQPYTITSTNINSGGVTRTFQRDTGFGDPLPSLRFDGQGSRNIPAFVVRDIGIITPCTILFESDFLFSANGNNWSQFIGWRCFTDAQGAGGILIGTDCDNANTTFVCGSAQAVEQPVVLAPGTWYHMKITATPTSATAVHIEFQILLGASLIFTLSADSQVTSGSGFGYEAWSGIGGDGFGGFRSFYFDNEIIQATAPDAPPPVQSATSYVYTFINDLGEESAPSPASATTIRTIGQKVTVTTSTVVPTGFPDFHILTKRIYRSVTGPTGTSFQFVAEIPLAQLTYDDILSDLQLGETLQSDNWDLPPSDLRGILALPNGIYCGFRLNQLCFSVQGRPHAWPVAFRLATDFPIVAIGAIDTTVVIGTTGFPYLAAGNAPDAYSMAKLEVPQGCASKRSLTYLRSLGVIYATPDGLMAVSGTGQAALITEQIFTRKEWQALNPTSMIAKAHDDRYFCFFDVNGAKGGFCLEMKQGGFGKITLAFHPTAIFGDTSNDTLYMVLDDNTPPALGGSPVTGQVTPDGITVFAFDSYDGGTPALSALLPQSYKSKLWQLPEPTSFSIAQVKALDFDDLMVRFIADGVPYYEKTVTSQKEFVLPALEAFSYEMQLFGTSRVTQIEVAEAVEELT